MKFIKLSLLMIVFAFITPVALADYGNSTKYPDTVCTLGSRVIYIDSVAQSTQYNADHTAESVARELSQRLGKEVRVRTPDKICNTVWRNNPTYSSSTMSSSSRSSSFSSRSSSRASLSSSSRSSSSVSSSRSISSSSSSSRSSSLSSSSSSTREEGILVRTYIEVPNLDYEGVDTEEELLLLPNLLNQTTPTSAQVETAPNAPTIEVDTAVRFTFYIHLKSTDVVNFVAEMDDTMFISIDGVPFYSLPFDTWGTRTSPTFTPNQDRFYLIDWIGYNGTGRGQLTPSITINDVTYELSSQFFTIETDDTIPVVVAPPNSSSSSSRSSVQSEGQTVTVQWTPPIERENGVALSISEIGGYEIRQMVNGSYEHITITNKDATQHSFTYYGGEVQIAVYDTAGLYSQYVNVPDNR